MVFWNIQPISSSTRHSNRKSVHEKKYYENNVLTGFSLLETVREMEQSPKIIYSSSSSTYGIPFQFPIKEDCPQIPISPYGRSKLIVEWLLLDYHLKYQQPYTILRYFNVAGCHPEGTLGEQHNPEHHLIPRMITAAINKEPIHINGKCYDTPDGTCIRDFVNVWDIAMAHALAARRKHGAKIVVIDIYRNATAKQADLFVCVKPGTDGALACAVMHVLFRDGYADRTYLARYTDCAEDLEAHLASRTPAWASVICGVPTATEAFSVGGPQANTVSAPSTTPKIR